jgi:16S rRNA (adenine1518-N6/adenine1519-N6)-dimethyltransferase
MKVHELLRQWQIQPSKSLGQNFLVEPVILERIVDAAELSCQDTVLEIGAGLGTLTEYLAQQAGHVVAVEIDKHLLPILRSVMRPLENVTIVEGDILALQPSDLIDVPSERYQVVANLPYYITSAVLRHLLESDLKPQRMVLTVQREVADRITAEPGDMSLLAVSVQFYGSPQTLFRIKPGSFYPSPSVESAVLRIDVHPRPTVEVPDGETFFRVVRAGFAQRRKQLHNTLSASLQLSSDEVSARMEDVGIDSRRRAQTLSLEEWGAVTRALSELV